MLYDLIFRVPKIIDNFVLTINELIRGFHWSNTEQFNNKYYT